MRAFVELGSPKKAQGDDDAWQRHASNAAWSEAKRITRVDVPMPERASVATTNVIPIRSAPPTPARSLEASTKGAGLDTVGIAKRVREDIVAAVRIGDLPKAKYSVRTDKYSMGSSITIEATHLPFPVLNAAAFHVVGNWVELDRMHFSSRFTLEAQHLDRMLNRILKEYHWDRSDPMSDVYNERFHRDVRVTPRDGEWEAIEREKLAAVREEKPT